MPVALRIVLVFVVLLAGVVVWHQVDEAGDEQEEVEDGAGVGETPPPTPDARLEGRGTPTPAAAPGESAGESATSGSVTVRTVVSGTGGAVSDVLVRAEDSRGRRYERRTGTTGEFVFTGLAVGNARFEVVAPGWVAETHEEVEVKDEPTTVVLCLQRAVGAAGRVLSAVDDTPVAGARVVAAAALTVGDEDSEEGRDVWAVVETDADGVFRLAAVPVRDEVTITVLAHGFAREVRVVVFHADLSEAQDRDVVVRLRPGGRLRGTVLDRSGKGVPGARVYVFPDGDDHLREHPRGAWSDSVRTVSSLRTTTDADGRFVVGGMALDGRYAATAFGAGHVRAEDVNGIVPSTGEGDVAITLVLRTPATLEVVARDEEGRPVAGTRAWIGPYAFGVRDRVTDAEGRVRIEGLLPGQHFLRVQTDEFLPFIEQVELAEGATRRVDARLVRGASIAGIVVDDAGDPLADVRVHVEQEGGDGWPRSPVRTGEDGRFVSRGLEEGAHRVHAWATGFFFERLVGVVAPAADLRLVGVRLGVVRGRLVLPPGTPTPERILVGSYERSGGGGGSHEPWPSEPVTWHVTEAPRVLRIEGEGFAPWELEVRIEPGTTRDLGEILLTSGVDLAGTVVRRDGEPVPGAFVEVTQHSFRTTQTDAEGRFALRNLRPGRQQLEVRASSFLVRILEPNREATDLGMRVVLARGAVLRVRVLDAEGLPVVGMAVHVRSTEPSEDESDEEFETRTAWDETDEQGRVHARLAPGTYRVAAMVAEYTLAEGEVTLAEGGVTLAEGDSTEVVLRVP